jgi:hypothetical protein
VRLKVPGGKTVTFERTSVGGGSDGHIRVRTLASCRLSYAPGSTQAWTFLFCFGRLLTKLHRRVRSMMLKRLALRSHLSSLCVGSSLGPGFILYQSECEKHAPSLLLHLSEPPTHGGVFFWPFSHFGKFQGSVRPCPGSGQIFGFWEARCPIRTKIRHLGQSLSGHIVSKLVYRTEYYPGPPHDLRGHGLQGPTHRRFVYTPRDPTLPRGCPSLCDVTPRPI